MLIRHVTYHGHLAKLVNIGENMLQRNSFPECSLERKYTVIVPAVKYNCEWEGCESIQFNTYHDFLAHVECHVNGAPSGKETKTNANVIPCLWSGKYIVCNIMYCGVIKKKLFEFVLRS